MRAKQGSCNISNTQRQRCIIISTKSIVLLAALLVASSVGLGCEDENPRRPRRMSWQTSQSPAYDRFENRNVAEVRFAPSGHRGTGSIIYTNKTSSGLQFDGFKGAVGAFEPVDDQPDMVFAVFYNADDATDPPKMQCQILVRQTVLNGAIIGNLGNVIVLCNLTDQQSEQVLEQGVPTGLVEEMVRTALDNGWSSQIDRSNPYTLIYVDADRWVVPSCDQRDDGADDRD